MKKDTIYIDVEDDITSIIEKVKASKSKIVALVPPKRSTVLSSAVNAKLLKRAAEDSGKRVVLITNDAALMTLAGGLGVHVAKNLQSKPYLPDAPEVPIAEDSVIEGDLSDLDPKTPVGDLTGVAVVAGAAGVAAKAKNGEKTDDKSADGKKEKKPKGKKSFKIPNFEGFRIKIILGSVAVVLLAIAWWWAFWIAPAAEVNILAQTSQLDTGIDFIVDTALESSDLEKTVLKGTVKELKKTVTEDFVATGEENVGKKASGVITIVNCDYALGVTFAAGTQYVASGYVYVSTESISVSGYSGSASDCSAGIIPSGTGSGNIQATEPGGEYNRDPSEVYSVAGESGAVSGTVAGWDILGTTEMKKVVSQEDFDKAKANLTTRDYSKEKEELATLFGEELVGMEETFEFKIGKTTSAPAVGEAAEKAILSAEVVFTEVGVATSDLETMLKDFQEPKIDSATQSIYDNGLGSATYELRKDLGKGKYDFRMRTVGIVGPNIDTGALALQIEGKRYSEAESIVNALPGVVSSEIKLSPFWVNKVPSVSKTTINVEVEEQNLQ